MRWISRSRRSALRALVLALGAGSFPVGIAGASAVSYTTDGQTTPEPVSGPALVHFEGASGTLAPGSPLRLGSFVIDPPKAGSVTHYQDTPFTIELRAPGFNRTIPAASPVGLRTEIDNSAVISGRLTGTLANGQPSSLIAVFDAIRPGGLRAMTTDHVHTYTFPVPLADVVLPRVSFLVSPTDVWAGSTPLRGELVAQAVPEPASALVFLASLVGASAYRRRAR